MALPEALPRPSAAQALALATITEHETQIIARAVHWAQIASGSRNLNGLARQRVALADAFAVLPGETVEQPLQPTIEVDGDGREIELAHPPAIRLTVRPDAPVQVVLTGHYDTVYPAESAFCSVTTRPDGALNGPGIADMKGGLSVMLAALQALEQFEAREQVGYRVLLSPDEEIGSPASAPVLAELARLGHVGLTYEPALGDGALAAARKGSGNFHILVKGRAAHAGRDFAAGRNALAAAARLAAELDALNGRRDGVTLNVAKIEGGAPLNVVPDTAVLRFNVRVPDAGAMTWTKAAVAEAIARAAGDGLSFQTFGGFTRPPKPFDHAQAQLFDAIRDTGARLGQTIAWSPSGGVCEGNNLHAAGLPNADSLGVRGGLIHSDAEFAWPDSFVERAHLSALLLLRLAAGEIQLPR